MSVLYAAIGGFILCVVIYSLREFAGAKSAKNMRKDLDGLMELRRSLDEAEEPKGK